MNPRLADLTGESLSQRGRRRTFRYCGQASEKQNFCRKEIAKLAYI